MRLNCPVRAIDDDYYFHQAVLFSIHHYCRSRRGILLFVDCRQNWKKQSTVSLNTPRLHQRFPKSMTRLDIPPNLSYVQRYLYHSTIFSLLLIQKNKDDLPMNNAAQHVCECIDHTRRLHKLDIPITWSTSHIDNMSWIGKFVLMKNGPAVQRFRPDHSDLGDSLLLSTAQLTTSATVIR